MAGMIACDIKRCPKFDTKAKMNCRLYKEIAAREKLCLFFAFDAEGSEEITATSAAMKNKTMEDVVDMKAIIEAMAPNKPAAIEAMFVTRIPIQDIWQMVHREGGDEKTYLVVYIDVFEMLKRTMKEKGRHTPPMGVYASIAGIPIIEDDDKLIEILKEVIEDDGQRKKDEGCPRPDSNW